MRNSIFFGVALLGAIGVWRLADGVAFSQGSGSSRLSPPRRTRPQTPAEFQQNFWRHITVTTPYRQWATWPVSDEQPRAGGGAHGPWVKTYANSAAAQAPGGLPYGSILINEEYDDDAKTLLAVSVMYCVRGVDPDHYDWYWLKYSPQGKVMRAAAEQGGRPLPRKPVPGKPLAGKVRSCIECHRKAADDLVFSNDDAEKTPDDSDDEPRGENE